MSATSPEEVLVELKRNNPDLVDIGFRDLFCYKLDKDYIINRRDCSLKQG